MLNQVAHWVQVAYVNLRLPATGKKTARSILERKPMMTFSALLALYERKPFPHKGQYVELWYFFFELAWKSCYSNIWIAGDLKRHYRLVYTQLYCVHSSPLVFYAVLSSYIAYFREPHRLSMGLTKLSRVTWQAYLSWFDSVEFLLYHTGWFYFVYLKRYSVAVQLCTLGCGIVSGSPQ